MVILGLLGMLGGTCNSDALPLQRPSPPGGLDNSRLPTPATVRGRVRNETTGKPIVGAIVLLESRMGLPLAQTFTNGDGLFLFQNMNNERANWLRVKKEGYRDYVYDVSTTGVLQSQYSIELEPLAGQPGTGPQFSPAISVRRLQIPPDARKAFDKGWKEYRKKNKPENSLPHFRKALELYKEYDEAYVELSLALMDLDRLPEAQEVAETAIQINPDAPQAYTLLGLIYKKSGQADRAVETLRRAIELDPENWVSQAELSQLLVMSGKVRSAYPHAEKAHELNPEKPELHLLLLNLAVKKNDVDVVEAELREFLKLFPDHPAVPEIQRRLNLIVQYRARRGNQP